MGHRESELCLALTEVYTDHNSLARMLYLSVNQNVARFAGPTAGLHDVIKCVVETAAVEEWLESLASAALEDRPRSQRLRAWRQAHCAPRQDAESPGPTPAWQLMDTAYFDLLEIRRRIRKAMSLAVGQVIGIGITDPEVMFVEKLLHWLQGHADANPKPHLSLHPLVRNQAEWLAQVREYREDLEEVCVLLEVKVDGTLADDAIERFWTGVCREFSGANCRLILVFTGIRDAYPDGVTVLPAPQFKYDDVEEWAETVLRHRGWPLDLSAAWATWVCARATLDIQPDVLSVRLLYRAMGKSIDAFRKASSPAHFRAFLENRMI